MDAEPSRLGAASHFRAAVGYTDMVTSDGDRRCKGLQ
jgi:hypothetical protein